MPDGEGGGTAAGESRVVRLLVRKNKELERDNQKYRDQIKDLNTKVEKLPANGAVVLTAEDAKAFDAFKALNVKPDEIAKALDEGKKAAGELTELKEREADRDAAAAVGFHATVLSDLRKTKGLALEMRDTVVEEAGKKVTKKLPHVRPASDEKAQWSPLTDYAAANLKEYLPALEAKSGDSSNGDEKPAPTSWPPGQMGGDGKPAKGDRAGAFLEQRAKASALEKSPLAKAAGLK